MPERLAFLWGPAGSSPARIKRGANLRHPEATLQWCPIREKKWRNYPPLAYPFDILFDALHAQNAQRAQRLVITLLIISIVLMQDPATD